MPSLFLGLLALVVGLWLVKTFARLDPQHLIKFGRTAGGVAALAGAGLLGSRGQIFAALPLLSLGLGLLGWMPAGMRALWPFGQLGGGGRASRVRSNFIEMRLDHDSGAMSGTIIAGRLRGTPLDALESAVLVGLLGEFDQESQNLLAAYLDRRHPGWREHAQHGAAAGGGAARSGKMSDEEAYQILGLEPGASAEEIGRAHRGLMKKLHPDQGGSTYLAARVNEAKDVLLRRH